MVPILSQLSHPPPALATGFNSSVKVLKEDLNHAYASVELLQVHGTAFLQALLTLTQYFLLRPCLLLFFR